jgi:NADPH:quinone reductase-like Zn-dependent oxidoreductase
VDAVFDLAGKGALEDSIALRGGTGRIVTTVAAYPLDRAATAQQVSDAGHVRGKLVLTVD